MRQLARIITDCGHRGKVGQVYEIIEKNPRDGFRLVMPGKTQFTFWYPAECVEEVEPEHALFQTGMMQLWALMVYLLTLQSGQKV